MDNNKKEEMLNFIEAARVSETNYRAFEISNKLSDRLALAIKEILGIDVSEYKNEIFEDIIRHIELHHGKHGVSDHRGVPCPSEYYGKYGNFDRNRGYYRNIW